MRTSKGRVDGGEDILPPELGRAGPMGHGREHHTEC